MGISHPEMSSDHLDGYLDPMRWHWLDHSNYTPLNLEFDENLVGGRKSFVVLLFFYPQCISVNLILVTTRLLFGIFCQWCFFCYWLQYCTFKLELPEKWWPVPGSSGTLSYGIDLAWALACWGRPRSGLCGRWRRQSPWPARRPPAPRLGDTMHWC